MRCENHTTEHGLLRHILHPTLISLDHNVSCCGTISHSFNLNLRCGNGENNVQKNRVDLGSQNADPALLGTSGFAFFHLFKRLYVSTF